jgi:hypothetical protein
MSEFIADCAGRDCGEEDVRQFLIGAGVAGLDTDFAALPQWEFWGFLPAGALLVWRSRGSLRGSRHRGFRAPRCSDPASPRNHYGAVAARSHRCAERRPSQRDRGGARWRPRLDARKPRGVPRGARRARGRSRDSLGRTVEHANADLLTMRRKMLALALTVGALTIPASSAFGNPDFGPGNSSKGPNDPGAKCHAPVMAPAPEPTNQSPAARGRAGPTTGGPFPINMNATRGPEHPGAATEEGPNRERRCRPVVSAGPSRH